MGRVIFQNPSFMFEKFLHFVERVRFPAAGLKDQNLAMHIPGALKSQNISVHYQVDLKIFTVLSI